MRNKFVLFFVIIFLFVWGIKGFSKHYYKKHYNIVLITIDMLRADRLGIYGYDKNTTPHLDEFARKNIVFMNAYSQASWTPPSLASILSGTNPNVHGIGDWDNIANSQVKFLTKRLPAEIYNTAFITNHPSLFLDNLGYTTNYNRRIVLRNDERAAQVTKLAIGWLNRNLSSKKAFSLWVHYFDPHEPFTPSEPFRSDFLKNYGNNTQSNEAPVCEKENYYGLDCIAPYIIVDGNADVNYYSLLYDAEIAEVDYAIGELLRQIEKMKLMDDTIIIITSDHGEIIKRCGVLGNKCVYLSHGTFLFNELIHVPLILHIPGQNKFVKVFENVATVDILPTLSYLIKDMDNQGYNGVPLLPLDKLNKYRKVYSYEIRLNWIASIYKKWEMISYRDFKELYRIDGDKDELIEFPNLYEPVSSRISQILSDSLQGKTSIKYWKEKKMDKQIMENLNSIGYCGNIENYFENLNIK